MSYQAEKSLTSAPMIPPVWSHSIQPSVTKSQIVTQMKKLNQEINTTLARTDLNLDMQARDRGATLRFGGWGGGGGHPFSGSILGGGTHDTFSY